MALDQTKALFWAAMTSLPGNYKTLDEIAERKQGKYVAEHLRQSCKQEH